MIDGLLRNQAEARVCTRQWLRARLAAFLVVSVITAACAPKLAPRESAATLTQKSAVLHDRFGDPLPTRAVLRLGTLRFRHHEQTAYLSLSPDEKYLVTSHGKKVILWRFPSGERLWTLTVPDGFAYSAAVSPDSRFVATGWQYDKNVVRVLALDTGAEVAHFDGEGSLEAASFHPTAPLLAYCARRRVYVVDTSTWQPHPAWTAALAAEDDVYDLAFSPDGAWLALRHLDELLRSHVSLWDTRSMKPALELECNDNVKVFGFSLDGRRLATSATGQHDEGCLWNLDTRKLQQRLPPLAANVLAFFDNGRKLAAGGEPGPGQFGQEVLLRDLATGVIVDSLHWHKRRVTGLAISRDGLLVSAGEDPGLQIWDLRRKAPHPASLGHAGSVTGVRFSPDGRYVGTAGDDGTARLWDARTGEHLRVYDGHRSLVFSVDVFDDGGVFTSSQTGFRIFRPNVVEPTFHETIASGSYTRWHPRDRGRAYLNGGRVVLADYETAEVRTLESAKSIKHFAFSPEGERVVTQTEDGIAVWDWKSGAQREEIVAGGQVIPSAVFSSDGERVLFARAGSGVEVWRLEPTPRQVGALQAPGGEAVDWVAYSPRGDRVAARLGKTRVVLWDPVTESVVDTLAGHELGIWDLAFSPDGCRLATASRDTTVLLWDVYGDGRCPADASADAAELGPAPQR